MGETPKSSANDWNPAQSTARESLVAEEPRPSAKALPPPPAAPRAYSEKSFERRPTCSESTPALGVIARPGVRGLRAALPGVRDAAAVGPWSDPNAAVGVVGTAMVGRSGGVPAFGCHG